MIDNYIELNNFVCYYLIFSNSKNTLIIGTNNDIIIYDF
jgi:hypothetical protein